jgi:hypothetical protein
MMNLFKSRYGNVCHARVLEMLAGKSQDQSQDDSQSLQEANNKDWPTFPMWTLMIHARVVSISFFWCHLFTQQPMIRFIDFNISAVVKMRDGSNSPFTVAVTSSTTFDKFRSDVAEKLQCFPGLLELRYRLDTDKQKTAATSIKTVEEFEIFKDRMRSLIVPQRLPSGKLSTRILKPVTVSFEDGAENPVHNPSQTSQGSVKKVCSILLYGVLCYWKTHKDRIISTIKYRGQFIKH